MNILMKMEEKTMVFERMNQAMQEQDAVIAEANKKKEQLKEEMIRLQGEYRLLVELGQEAGVVDDAGQPIPQVQDEEVPEEHIVEEVKTE
jgi:hypothetical protein